MTQQEIIDFGDKLTKKMGGAINSTPNKTINFAPENGDNKTMKLRVKVSEIGGKLQITNLLMSSIIVELKDVYNTSGLKTKKNGRIIVSKFSLTPQIFDPTTIKNEYGLLCSYRYEYDSTPAKDPNFLDRY